MCSKRCNSNDAISVFEILAQELRATLLSNLSSRGLRGLTAGPDCGARGRRRGPAGSCPAPPDWRPPRGLRGLAGLRDEAPSAARLPSLAGGQASRRSEIWRQPETGRRSEIWRQPETGRRPEIWRQPETGRRSEIRRRRNQTKSGGPQKNLGATTHAFTDVN